MLDVKQRPGWESAHGTVEVAEPKVAKPTNEAPDPEDDGWRHGLAALRELVRRAEHDEKRLTLLGSAWSLSGAIAPPEDAWLVRMRHLSAIPEVGLAEEWTDDPNPGRLVYAQAGAEITDLHVELASNDLSLPTSGASSGQTIAGAVSTDTHGSALEYGGLPQAVRGIHLVVDGGRSLWLEPEEAPGVTSAWLEHVEADLCRDTDLFEAALVSFGSFGICHGLLLEAEPLFLLRRHRRTHDLQYVLDGVYADGEEVEIGEWLLPEGRDDLYHFEVKIDPNVPDDKAALVETIYRTGRCDDYEYTDQDPSDLEIASDTLEMIGGLIEKFGSVPVAGDVADARIERETRKVMEEQFPETGEHPEEGALGEVFPKSEVPVGGTSVEYAVDAERLRPALETVLETLREAPFAFPGLIGVRFVPQSPATLGFTRFDLSCTIEIPAVESDAIHELLTRVTRNLDEMVAFTMHWGQQIPWETVDLEGMYGTEAVEQWRRARETLLGEAGREMFRNRLLDASGLG